MELKLDYSPLTAQLTALQAKQILSGKPNQRSGFTIFAYIIFGIFGLGFIAIFAGVISVFFGSSGNSNANPVLPIVLIIALAAFSVLIFFVYRNAQIKRAKLTWFAEANGFNYQSSTSAPYYPAMIFGPGHSKGAKDRFMRLSGRPIDIANYTYITGSGKSQQRHNWFYMMVQLDRNLPHIVLDATRNNFWKISNLPASFSKDQVLSLEGDFDKHFKLYCPKGYERDALYVLNPKLMALMIDFANSTDIEIIDNKLFLFGGGQFNLSDPGTWGFIQAVVNNVGVETVKQTDYYSDERIGNRQMDVVSVEGQRLKSSLWPLYFVGAVAAVGLVIWFMSRFG